jgi:repressor LexA
MSLDEYLIEDPNRSFLLKVSGDSLLNIGIFDGDIVVVEKKALAYPGDIVLAEIDKEWTLKIYKKDLKKKTVYLEPANPKYPLLYPQRELVIHGVVKGVIRKIIN